MSIFSNFNHLLISLHLEVVHHHLLIELCLLILKNLLLVYLGLLILGSGPLQTHQIMVVDLLIKAAFVTRISMLQLLLVYHRQLHVVIVRKYELWF